MMEWGSNLEEKVIKLDPDTMTYLQRIADGVMMILWILVSAIVFWPLSRAAASYTDTEQATTLSNIVALAIAILAGYFFTRLVFPIEYSSTQNKVPVENQ